LRKWIGLLIHNKRKAEKEKGGRNLFSDREPIFSPHEGVVIACAAPGEGDFSTSRKEYAP
jgi:hypothetical protein